MDEEQQEQTAQDTATEQPEAKAEETPAEEAQEALPKTFTQDEVNQIVKDRLDRQTERFLKRLSLESMDGIDQLLEHANGYAEAQELMTRYQLENEDLRQQIAFRDNGVDPNRYDDVKAYFKGKGLDLTADELKAQLETHPEWALKKPQTTTIRRLSPEKSAPKTVDEWQQARKYFGL